MDITPLFTPDTQYRSFLLNQKDLSFYLSYLQNNYFFIIFIHIYN